MDHISKRLPAALGAMPPPRKPHEDVRVSPDERAALDKDHRDAAYIARELELAGVPLRYRQIELRDDLVPESLRAWAQRFALALREGGSALLDGPPGAGKTATAVWLLRAAYLSGQVEVAVEYGRWDERIERARWVAPSIALVAAGDLYRAVFRREDTFLERCAQVDLLAIDDWGASYEHEWPLAEVDRLVDLRWSQLRSTIVTTNLRPRHSDAGPQSFEARYPRVYSRLRDAVGPGLVTLVRSDLRRTS